MTAYFKIPATRVPWSSFTTTLSGATYTLELRYNSRMSRWMLTIGDAVGKTIVAGLPLLNQRELLRQYPNLPVPVGPLWVVDRSGTGAQPTLASFLVDHDLVYEDSTV